METLDCEEDTLGSMGKSKSENYLWWLEVWKLANWIRKKHIHCWSRHINVSLINVLHTKIQIQNIYIYIKSGMSTIILSYFYIAVHSESMNYHNLRNPCLRPPKIRCIFARTCFNHLKDLNLKHAGEKSVNSFHSWTYYYFTHKEY